MDEYAVGVIGLGVMGSNLALNMADRGFAVLGYDVSERKRQEFVQGGGSLPIAQADSPEALLGRLERPRRILMMVPAGPPVDSVIDRIAPSLGKGDVLIDGGNSHFLDTDARNQQLETRGIHFVGCGISGGESGARFGPSLMPGGQPEAWEAIAPILLAIAARASDEEPCAAYMGPRGAGHYVKMVHNGIEYADMQLIAEAYDLLHRGLGFTNAELHDVFRGWSQSELESYLIDITANIFRTVDPDTNHALLDLVLDEAEQKGTGRWTSQNGLDIGTPIPTINAAVEARLLSSLKEERVTASAVLKGPNLPGHAERVALVDAVREALYASKVTAYAQGFGLLRRASAEYGYAMRPFDVARIWRAGCIIRARLLDDIMDAYRHEPDLTTLMMSPHFAEALMMRQRGWRLTVSTAVQLGIPMPAMSASLAYYDAYRSQRLPANLVQAQRDFFGAHTFRRTDRPGVFHANWS